MTPLEELEKVIEDFYKSLGYEVKATIKKKEEKEKENGSRV